MVTATEFTLTLGVRSPSASFSSIISVMGQSPVSSLPGRSVQTDTARVTVVSAGGAGLNSPPIGPRTVT